ncbi:hypothetical protein V5O48_015877 [Marasmius crinis-equi]|uniref:DUF6699 domain-containing protein n=1 Tax=Marasmius crinis-equi TaxID=585013 RepID=A0ABR3ETA6_9AGAR
MYDDDEWVVIPDITSGPSPSTSTRPTHYGSHLTTPVVPPRSISPSAPIQIYSPVMPHNQRRVHTPFPRGASPQDPQEGRGYSPQYRSSPSNPPVVPPSNGPSPSLLFSPPPPSPQVGGYIPHMRSSPSNPAVIPPFAAPPPPPLLSPSYHPPEAEGYRMPAFGSSPTVPPVIPPNLSPVGHRPSSARPSLPSRSPLPRTSSTPARSPRMAASSPEVFIPPEDPPTPPPDPAARRRRSSGPLVGERQGWAYPVDLSGTGLAYPIHSTPYGAYTPLPPYAPASAYTPYPSQYPPFTPHLASASLYPPFQPPHPGQYYPPPYATPMPFQASTIHNTPHLPPTSQLPTYALPASTPLNAATVPLPLPQPESVLPHSDILALGGGMTCLDWDLLFPPTPEYATLVNPPTPYARPKFSEPAFKTGFVVSQLFLRSSSHQVLAYWMDIWGPLTLSEIPTVQGLLEAIHQYLHTPLTSSDLDNLLSTPENKENVVHARRMRIREGCDLGLNEGFKRVDVLGTHRKFAGIWIGAIELDERGETLEVEIMVAVRPNGL